MNKDFQEFLKLWRATDLYITTPNEANQQAAQMVVDKIVGTGDTQTPQIEVNPAYPELQRIIDALSAGELNIAHALLALEELRDLLSKQMLELETERAGLVASKETLTTIGKSLKDRVERLENTEDAVCPLCGQPLDEQHREELIAELNVELEQHRADYRANQDGMTLIKAQISEIREKDAATETEIERQRHRR